jgi:hypothetical protein
MFSMLGVNTAYVTTLGRLIGVVGLVELRKAIEDVNAGRRPPETTAKPSSDDDDEDDDDVEARSGTAASASKPVIITSDADGGENAEDALLPRDQ